MEISQPVLSLLKLATAANPSYKIVFTGHSLGGAVATLAAAYARAAGYTIDIYTYGSPRVGNEAFVKFVTDQPGGEYRITHLADPVPRLPPIFMGYRHTAPEFWLSTGDSETTEYTAADVKICDGFSNTDCNGGTFGLDIDAHSYYLGPISSCGADGLSWKREVASEMSSATTLSVTSDMSTTVHSDMTDEKLLDRLNDFVLLDIAYAAELEE